jgi:tetratricopeptide (TPR) repeat protein
VERVEEALEVLKLAEQIYEYSYSTVDKRTCKVKRNVALLYLKLNRYDEALDELKEVEDFRRIWPFFRDRRIDTYAPLTKRYIDE